jgi:Kef-type K+ transport system membrane component KefB
MDIRQKFSAFLVLVLLLIIDGTHGGTIATIFVTLEILCLVLLVAGVGRDLWQWLTRHVKDNVWLNNGDATEIEKESNQ